MKILKKTIVVLLVLIMALGMIPFGYAAEFDDDDDVSYKEAVDVLAGISVIEGFPGNEFKPLEGVTRAQAAAIIARLMLGRKLADSLPDAPTGFPDCDGVSGVGFAIKYIRYCASQGIIVGYPNGNFGPNDPVTASQFAVMLLRALKIGDTDRYVGVDWQMFAILDGIDNGILDKVNDDVDFTKAANREETAQYAFNGLIFSPSGKKEEIWVVKSYTTVEDPDDPSRTILVPVYGWEEVPGKDPDSVWGKVYKFDKLERFNDYDDGAYNDLGRPALTWKWNDKTIHNSVDKPVKVYEEGISQGDLYKLIGEGNIKVVVNQAGGQIATATSLLRAKKGVDDSASASIYTKATNDQDGRGIITEIYKIKDTGEVKDDYIAVVIKPSFGEVEVDSEAETDDKGAYKSYLFSNGDEGFIFSSVKDEEDDVDSAVLIGAVADGDMVLYYMGEENLYVEAVDDISGTVTGATSGGVYTVGGKGHKLAQAANINDIGVDKDKEVSFFVDSFGNILGIKKGDADPVKLALVLTIDQYWELDGTKMVDKYSADIVGLDGVVKTVPSTKGMWNSRFEIQGKVQLYDDDTKGYTFEDPANDDDHYALTEIYEIDFKKSGTSLAVSSPNAYTSFVKFAGNSTKFVVVNFEDDEPDGTVKLFTGRNNVPNYGAVAGTVAVSYNADGDANNIADIVYIFDLTLSSSASDSFVFVIGTWNQDPDGFAVDVIMDGAKEKLIVNRAGRDALLAVKGKLIEEVKIDSDGRILNLVSGSLEPLVIELREFTKLQNNGGLLKIEGEYAGTYEIANGVPVYVINIPTSGLNNASVTEKKAEDYGSSTSFSFAGIYMVDEDGNEVGITSSSSDEVDAIYIVVGYFR